MFPIGGLMGGIGSAFAAMGRHGSADQQQHMMNIHLENQRLEMMRQSMMQGPWRLPPTLQKLSDLRNEVGVHTCSYCGRQTKKPDIEGGCRGCGASEWE